MRKDGRRVKHGDPMYTIVPHIMVERSDSMNMCEMFTPMAPMNEYIRDKKKDGIIISHLALVISAYVRTVAEFPQINRFIVNRKIYARKGIQIGMVVLKPGTEDETMSKMNFMPENDIFEVNRILIEYITKNRKSDEKNSTDKMIGGLLKVPGLCRVGVGLFKWLDKHGILPKKVIDLSPFHASMTITNLASIRANHIYHHIYNFGTTSQLISMGNLREVPHKDIDGEIVYERSIPFGIVMDERIATGKYYAKAFAKMQIYLKNPRLLEGTPEVCIREWEDKNI